MKNNRYLFSFTLLYFALGFINIHFALLGFVCMGFTSFFLLRDRKKTWCQNYCPRSRLYNQVGKLKPYSHLKTPRFLIKGPLKWIMLVYFLGSMLIILLSTMKVGISGMPPMDYLRFLLVIPIKGMPQLFSIPSPHWLLHLSYRLYSMMMTTTVLGLILALIYRPRTWCTVCPISTISDLYIKGGQGSI